MGAKPQFENNKSCYMYCPIHGNRNCVTVIFRLHLFELNDIRKFDMENDDFIQHRNA